MVILNISNTAGFNSSYLVLTMAPSYNPPQEINDQLENENTPLDNPLPNLEETSASTILASDLSPSSDEIQLSFQEGTSLTISHSLLTFLKEESPYFKNLWSGQFQETLQHPLDLTKEDFTLLLNCLTIPKFVIPLKKIPYSIQLAQYYGLIGLVKHLEEQLINEYNSQRFEPFDYTEESLIEFKELLNFAHCCQLNELKEDLELDIANVLLNATSQLAEFERTIKHLSNEIDILHFSKQTYLTDAHFSALKECKNLKILTFETCQALTDDGLAHLASLTALQHLGLRGCDKVTDAGLAHLTSLRALQYLDLSFCRNITDAGLAHLTPLTALQRLLLKKCENLTNAGLAHLTSLTALGYLDLSYWDNFIDDGLAHLRPLVALQHLNLANCYELTDAGLAHLRPLTGLQHLNLSYCVNLTDVGLAHLAPLLALQYLNLSDCKYLTDAGLAHLIPLTALQHLNLRDCRKLTDTGLASFKASILIQ
ncbi:leucine-rich repeat domain-containing protein [Candidatus Protochlamydia amoebophila]|nr:BTB/POZ domain-containing protein [Candidatus Protochlamydia amoebophila]